jgi:hypothetical protein
MCQGNMDSIFDVPTNLSALLEELIQRWQAASSQFQGPIFNAIEGADKEVEAYLQEIQRDLQGAHITALSSFYAGADFGHPGITADLSNVDIILLALSGPVVDDLSDGISNLLPAIDRAIERLTGRQTGIQMGAFPSDELLEGVEGGRLYLALQQISDFLNAANRKIAEDLSDLLWSPRVCAASSVQVGHPESTPTGLQSFADVKVSSELLTNFASVCVRGAETIDNEAQVTVRSLSNLTDVLASLAGVPVIGGTANTLLETLTEARSRLTLSMGCYITGLVMMAQNLLKAAGTLAEVDIKLSNLFTELHNQW